MPNEFERYRDALVMENVTIWPDEYDGWSTADKARVEARLHAAPDAAAELRYERQHSGFARVITVTEADIARVQTG